MEMDMDAADVTDALFRYFNAYRGYKYQLCNAYVFEWESDFFCIASSGYSYEIEVKVSRGDFFADFNKTEKHNILGSPFDFYNKPLDRNPETKLNLDKWTWEEDGYYHYRNGQLNRHVKRKPPVCKFKRVKIGKIAPNKFLYAVPEGLVSAEEVPEYTGLIYVPADRRRKPEIVVRPPTIHAHKKDFTGILLDKYYWGYLNSLGQTKHGKNFDFPDQKNGQKMMRTR